MSTPEKSPVRLRRVSDLSWRLGECVLTRRGCVCVCVVVLCVAQAGGLTLWVKRTDKSDAQYDDTPAAPNETVAQFRRRWVAERKVDVDPGLVSLRLVPDTGDKEEPTPADESRATVLNPRKTLAEAGMVDGSCLLAVFARSGV